MSATTTALAEAITSECGRCGRRAFLTCTGESSPAECTPCYEAWHARPEPPTRRGYPGAPESCRHGVSATTRKRDGAGNLVRRRTCQHCGTITRTPAA